MPENARQVDASGATGIGSLPYDSPAEAVKSVFAELQDAEGPGWLPYLPELPGRGPAAGMTGRACGLLAELRADLQPGGWRLASGEGADQRRARSMLAQDLDALEQIADGYHGPLKVQVCGPWTLAATVERPRGGMVLGDSGARRDLAQSLAEGVSVHLADVRRRVPGARLVLQLDEPSLPAVLAGAVPTPSGYGSYRPVEEPEAIELLAYVIDAASGERAMPVVHCCARGVPVELLCRAGARGVAFHFAFLDDARFDAVAAAVEDGVQLLPGVVPSRRPAGSPPGARDLADRVRQWWRRLGFDAERLPHSCTVTPACGLAGSDPDWARTAHRLARETAVRLIPD